MKKSRLRIHKQTLQMMNNPPYIYLWVNPEQKTIAIRAGADNGRDMISTQKKRDFEVYSTALFYELRRLNRDMQDDCTYRLKGSVKNSTIAEFSLDELTVLKNASEMMKGEPDDSK